MRLQESDGGPATQTAESAPGNSPHVCAQSWGVTRAPGHLVGQARPDTTSEAPPTPSLENTAGTVREQAATKNLGKERVPELRHR